MSINVGDCVWERLPEGAEYETRGGRVYHAEDHLRDDGEWERVLKVAFAFGRRIEFKTVSDRDVDADMVEPLNEAMVRSLVRAMARELGAAKGRWGGRDSLLLDAMSGLASVL